MKGSTVIIVGIVVCMAASAVAATVKGVARDSDGESLPGVAAQLIALRDSTRAGYVLTETDGSFKFESLAPGD